MVPKCKKLSLRIIEVSENGPNSNIASHPIKIIQFFEDVRIVDI